MISCGEASGDLYAGALVDALREIDPGVEVFGFGGERLRAAGADLIGDYRGFSVTGLSEALPVLSRSWKMLNALREAARTRQPDVFVAVDFPDFNFRLLPAMRALGIKVVYYVSPQLWAWRPARLETIRRYVDRMIVIFPFEKELYERAGVPVEFVGHPLVDLARASQPRDAFLRSNKLDPARPVLALLPGSRPSELRHVLPGLTAAAPLISARVPGVQFLVARAPSLDDGLFAPLDVVRAAGLPVAIATGATDDVLASADAVVTASGTATVQAALHGTPMVIVYRLSAFTYAVGRRFVRVSSYGMVNLVAGRPIVPELIQGEFTPEAVAAEAASLLTDRARAETMRRDLAAVRATLGSPGASRRAARVIGDGGFFHRSGPQGAGGREGR
jgi:lipid-A-disaccharide synthase